MPSVTVIIPTFNRESLIECALQSVLKQQGVSFEVIVVDDGSSDGTRNLLSEKFPQATYLYQTNQGPSAARNRGIEKARGEWIAFLDSDDKWMPGKLKAQLDFFEANPEYRVCQTEEIWIRNGRRVNSMKKHKKFGGFIFEKCLPLCVVSPSAAMIHRSMFFNVGAIHPSARLAEATAKRAGEAGELPLRFDESLPACEDYDLWLQIAAHEPIGLIEEPYVVKYGGHSDQRSHEFPAMDRFRIYALKKILDSGKLTSGQEEAAQKMLEEKTKIYEAGAKKRSFVIPAKAGIHFSIDGSPGQAGG